MAKTPFRQTQHGHQRATERGIDNDTIADVLSEATPVRGNHPDENRPVWVFQWHNVVVVLDNAQETVITCFEKTSRRRGRYVRAPPIVR
jgi:hypothetical protein